MRLQGGCEVSLGLTVEYGRVAAPKNLAHCTLCGDRREFGKSLSDHGFERSGLHPVPPRKLAGGLAGASDSFGQEMARWGLLSVEWVGGYRYSRYICNAGNDHGRDTEASRQGHTAVAERS